MPKNTTFRFSMPCAIRQWRACFLFAGFVSVLLVGGFNPKVAEAFGLADTDQDGMPDLWEMLNNLAPYDSTDAALDSDGDGAINLSEYRAGTDPHSAESVLKFTKVTKTASNEVQLQFKAMARHSYLVVFRTGNQSTNWVNLFDISAAPTNTLVEVTDVLPLGSVEQRFYNVITWELR